MKILITGCGHSATRYIAEVLKAAGFKAEHENVFTPNKKKVQKADIEVSWCALGMIDSNTKLPEEIWHVVRDPMKVASSFLNQGLFGKKSDPYCKLVRDSIKLGKTHPEMDYWLQWNEKAEKICTWAFTVEGMDINELVDKVSATLGIAVSPEQRRAAHLVGKIGASGAPLIYDVTGYGNLKKLQRYAAKYGYSVPNGQVDLDRHKALLGSDKLPSVVQLADDTEVQSGDIVSKAHQDSGMTVDQWNAQPEDDMEAKIQAALGNMEHEAKAKAKARVEKQKKAEKDEADSLEEEE